MTSSLQTLCQKSRADSAPSKASIEVQAERHIQHAKVFEPAPEEMYVWKT